MDLTAEQRRVADTLEGTLLVLAAVGSGKTTTLSERVAQAIEAGFEPARILALTFTNRAAQHMRESLQARDAVAARRIHVHTFHGLCAWILRTEARRLGLPPELWVHDEEDAEALIRSLGVPKARNAMFTLHGEMSSEAIGQATLARYHNAAFSKEPWAERYLRALGERGAIDFAGLVYLTRAAFTDDQACAQRWASRFDLVQVDEVQDTHISEYEVIRHLAGSARSLCMVGDLDQTIYGWRGSAPQRIIEQLGVDRGEIKTIELSENFRATQALLRTADEVASGLKQRATQVIAHKDLPEGSPPEYDVYPSPDDEAVGIARKCAQRVSDGEDPRSMAILTRANWMTTLIAKALDAHQVPHATVETFRYFRRMEVKDALALLKLVVDRNTPTAAQRIAMKLVRGVGKQTLQRIQREGGDAGLRLVDLLDTTIVEKGDPLWGLEADEYIVLDTETTGVDPTSDEVIEVAAVRVRLGEIVDSYQALIRPTQEVGASEGVHNLSDALLAEEGRPPAEVFQEFAAFIGNTPVAGHNVRFDLRMLIAHGARVGMAFTFGPHFDSLRYARRLLRQDSYRLGDLATALELPVDPTHRALDDVHTTVHLLRVLGDHGRRGVGIRCQLMAELAPNFDRLRERLDQWASLDERPGVLAHRILNEGGLLAYYQRRIEPERLRNLEQLSTRVAKLDNPNLTVVEAARHVLDRSALAREQDLLDDTGGIRVITIHQSKGLEFDTVYVPGLVDGRFPTWGAIQSGSTEEERRVFYVAITRAKRSLILSGYERDKNGACSPSRFMEGLSL